MKSGERIAKSEESTFAKRTYRARGRYRALIYSLFVVQVAQKTGGRSVHYAELIFLTYFFVDFYPLL